MINNKKILGFTLIELMMVLFIFSMMLSFILINTNFSINDEKKLENFAQNMIAQIKLAKQEAVFQHASIRLVFNKSNYVFQKLQQQDNKPIWKPLPHRAFYEETPIDKNIQIIYEPTLNIYPNGTFSPFAIILSHPKIKYRITIVGDEAGLIGLHHDS